MFARRAASTALRQCKHIRPVGASAASCAGAPFRQAAAKRSISTSSSSATVPVQSSAKVYPWGGVTQELDGLVPKFEIDASQIEIIDSPAAFYETLKDKIRSARKRIYLSTLYIGKTETELIDTLQQALRANPTLKVSILTDYLRGTREDPNPSCASLLLPLKQEFGDRVQVCMYHTPNLNGWKKKWMPKRINEGWGLQHMKLYGFDDEILLSGANLSDDYFTNRLDRYHLFKSKELSNHYASIHHAVCEISYDLVASAAEGTGFELQSPLYRGLPDPVWHPQRFRRHAKQLLEPLIHRRTRYNISPSAFDNTKTFVYPVAQFDPLLGPPTAEFIGGRRLNRISSTEKPVLTSLLTHMAEDEPLKNSSWTFTAGYFNIDPELCEYLLEATPSIPRTPESLQDGSKSCTVITASPWANGFYGSPGISGMLPAAYTLLSRRFLRQVDKERKSDVVQLKEWRKGTVGQPGGFTYHAKGIWVTIPSQTRQGAVIDEEGPSATLVGSSNYTRRSYSLDLEIGALIITGDQELKRRLAAEVNWLEKDATVTTQDDLMKIDRRVGAKVRASLWLVERLGGAL